MADNEARIVVTAEDRASSVFDSLSRTASKTASELAALNGVLGRFSGAGPATAIAAVAAAAATLTAHTVKYRASLHDLSMQSAASVEILSALRNVAELNDASLESVGKSAAKLARNMLEATTGGKEQAATFRALNVSVQDGTGKLRDSGDVMLEVAKRIAALESPTERAAAAQLVFGKSGGELVPMLMDLAEQGRLNTTVTAEQARKADELSDNLTKIKQNLRGMGENIGAELIGPLATATGWMEKFLRPEGGLQTVEIDWFDNFVLRTGRKLREGEKTLSEASARFWEAAGVNSWAAQARAAASEAEQALQDMNLRLQAVAERGVSLDAFGPRGGEKRKTKAFSALLNDAKAVESEYDKLIKSIRERTAVASAELASTEELTEGEKARAKILADLEAKTLKLTPVERKRVEQMLEEEVVAERLLKARKEMAAGIQAQYDAIISDIEAGQAADKLIAEQTNTIYASIHAMEERNIQLEQELEFYGMLPSQIEAVKLARLEEARAALAQVEGAEEAIAFYERLIEQQRRLAGGMRQKEELDKQVRFWESIDQTAHDTFVSIANANKNLWERMKETAQNTFFDWLYQMTLRPFVIQLAGSFSGQGVAQSLANSTAGGFGGSFAGTAAGNVATNWLPGGSLLGAYNTGAYMSLGGMGAEQAAMLAAQDAVFGSAGTAATLEAAGASSATASLAAAGPWIAAAVAAAAMLGAFDHEPAKPRGTFHTDPSRQYGAAWYEDSRAFADTPFGRIGFDDSSTSIASGQSLHDNILEPIRQLDEMLVQNLHLTAEQVTRISTQLAGITYGGGEGFGEAALEAAIRDRIDAVLAEVDPALHALFDSFNATGAEASALVANLMALQGQFEQLGFPADALSRDLIDQAGGVQALQQALATYTQAAYTEEERRARLLEETSAAFERLGYTLPEDVAGLRALVEAQERSTEADRGAWLELIRLAPAVAELARTAEQATPALADTAQQIEELMRTRTDAVRAAEEEVVRAYEREADAKRGLMEQMRGYVTTLRGFRQQLLLGDLSPLSQEAKYAEAAKQFEDLKRRAGLGDVSAMEQLQGGIEGLLQNSLATYGRNSTQYQADYDRSISVLENTESLAERQARLAEEQLTEITRQTGLLVDLNQGVLSLAEAIRGLNLARQTLGGGPNGAASWYAALGRTPDTAGLAYWGGRLAAGEDPDAVQSAFDRSAQIVQGVEQMYEQLAHRTGDTEGKAYWMGEVERLVAAGNTLQGAFWAVRQSFEAAVDIVEARGYAEGGLVTGGIPGRDSVPAWLMPGEEVVTTPVVDFVRRHAGGDTETRGLLREVSTELRELRTDLVAELRADKSQRGAAATATLERLDALADQLDGTRREIRRTGTNG